MEKQVYIPVTCPFQRACFLGCVDQRFTKRRYPVFFPKQRKKYRVRYSIAPFPTLVPAYFEEEFRYRLGKLEIKNAVGSGDFFRFPSFTWKNDGQSFEVSGNELYPFASTILGTFTYTKVR
jgi:hypothetical protein